VIPNPIFVRFVGGIGFRCPECFLRYDSVIKYQDHYEEMHK
jgi:hypothetical protein